MGNALFGSRKVLGEKEAVRKSGGDEKDALGSGRRAMAVGSMMEYVMDPGNMLADAARHTPPVRF